MLSPALLIQTQHLVSNRFHLIIFGVCIGAQNAYALDDRQKRIYKAVQELLSPSNYNAFSSVADHLGKVTFVVRQHAPHAYSCRIDMNDSVWSLCLRLCYRAP